MSWTELSAQFDQSNPIEDFTIDESRAFVDLAVLVMMVDEQVTNEELEKLSDQLAELPFADTDELEDNLGDQVAYARSSVDRIVGNAEQMDVFVQETAANIAGTDHRRHVLEMLATLAYSDDIDPAESDVCHQVGRAFGMDEDAIEAALLDGSIGRISGV